MSRDRAGPEAYWLALARSYSECSDWGTHIQVA